MFDCAAAFAPFFGDVVEFFLKRNNVVLRTSISCCVVDEGYTENYSDCSVASRRRQISVQLRIEDWSWPKMPPRIGDVVECRAMRFKGRVESVDNYDGELYTLVAIEQK